LIQNDGHSQDVT